MEDVRCHAFGAVRAKKSPKVHRRRLTHRNRRSGLLRDAV
jgi:hypothetical protein